MTKKLTRPAAHKITVSFIANVALSIAVGISLSRINAPAWLAVVIAPWYLNAVYGSWLRGYTAALDTLDQKLATAVMNGRAPQVAMIEDLIEYQRT